MEAKQIPTVLACDVGNSTIRFGCVHGDEPVEARSIGVGDIGELSSVLGELWTGPDKPSTIAACSVNPAAVDALAAAAKALGQEMLLVGRELPLPIATDLAHPEQVGADRLCCAAAAFDRLGMACVVADFGTAITIDCVRDDGVFLGGAILPGLAMSAKCLHNSTACLPDVKLSRPDWTFGKDTAQAIAGGLVFGARGALRLLTEAYATELGHWPSVVVTGGDAELVCGDRSEADMIQAIVPDLALRGVAMSYYRSLLK